MELALYGALIAAGVVWTLGTFSIAFFVSLVYVRWCDATRNGFDSDISIQLSPRAWQNAIRRASFWTWTLHRYFRFCVDDPGRLLCRSSSRNDEAPPPPHILMAIHPHGLFAVSALLGCILPPADVYAPGGAECLPTTFVHPIFFWVPLVRELFLLLGCRPATRGEMGARLLQRRPQGTTLPPPISVIVPGGIKELIHPDMYTAQYHEATAAPAQNWGFLTLAYRTGAHVVPCYCAAEARLFTIWGATPEWTTFRTFMYRWTGYPFPTIFNGPHRPARMCLRVGRAVVPPPYDPERETEDLARFKACYMDSLYSVKHCADEKDCAQ